MLTLDQNLTLNAAAINAPNLCDKFDDDDLRRIGQECHAGYLRDEQSRFRWMQRNEAGMDLALQVQKAKNFPWPECSNVAFPLVTIAAMQFHARAYPALVSEQQIVKVDRNAFGPDPDGQRSARADRVETHMSWQLKYEDKCWEEQEDKAIFNVSIVGTNFKKSYYSAAFSHNVSELVLAKDLVLNYWAKSVKGCPRKTHKIPLFRNDVYERVMRGTFRDVLEETWYTAAPPARTNVTQTNQDNRQGLTPPQSDDTTSLMFLEQHVDLDLDGDGYAEPYIITFEEQSKCVVRIVCRFDSEKDIERVASGSRKGKIIRINATEYFTDKTFIPSPDGGIYGLGFGVFLGPLNEAVNSLINQLIDAGTLQTTAGGFLGRGAKIRGGVYTIAPFEWKRVDSSGDDLRKSIFPLPVNAPSDVLFQLLSLLINYASRVAGTTDITVGENPGQNTPAQTTQTMVEMGQKIYTAVFKRLWRSTKEEFQKLFILNGKHLHPDVPHAGGATAADYAPGMEDQVCPVADPNITSQGARVQQAILLKQSAANTPGYNLDAVERRFLAAIQVDAPDEVFPGTQGQPPREDPKITLEKVKQQGSLQEKQMELQFRERELAITMMEEQRLNNAKIIELQAKADQEAANAQSEAAYAQVAAINAQIAAAKTQNEHLNSRIEHFLRMAELESRHVIEMKKATQTRQAA